MSAGQKQVILVTGGSRGIGQAITEHLAKLGHQVFATSRNVEPSATLQNIEMVQLDVQDNASVKRCIESVFSRAGRIDVLVNNAGYDLYGGLEDTSLEEFAAQVDTNLMGVVRMVKGVLPHMRKAGRGNIINIGSIGGRVALPMNSAYAASKFALEGFSESLRLEMLPANVYVSVIVPGSVATDTLETSVREVKDSSSALAQARVAMVKRMREDGKRSSLTPKHIASTVAQVLTSASPALYYAVGSQAVWVPRMKAFLPQGAFERVMRRLFPQQAPVGD